MEAWENYHWKIIHLEKKINKNKKTSFVGLALYGVTRDEFSVGPTPSQARLETGIMSGG
jgi:hypothetical protein